MADGIGQVNFYLSIINYISMFAGLEYRLIPFGEIARVKEQCERDESSGSGNTSNMYTFLTLLGYIVVGVVALTVAKVQVNLPLFL